MIQNSLSGTGMCRIGGVDGCPGGWILAIENHDGTTTVEVVKRFADIVARRDLRIVVVDIPIGLLQKGTREVDAEARKMLRKRACCVFTAPIRPILKASCWEEACSIGFEIEHKKVTRQTWGIIPKVIEVDDMMNPQLQEQIREGHPEVSFAEMNEGRAIAEKKKSLEGRRLRLDLLRKGFGDVDKSVAESGPLQSDVIDAYAMLWTARRVRAGEYRRIPIVLLRDCRGLAMEMVI